MKVSIGTITKSLDSANTLIQFVENAKKYGHEIDSAIVVCSDGTDRKVAEAIRKNTPLTVVDLNRPTQLENRLKTREISFASIETLLKCSALGESGLVPYGFNRNMALMEAITSEKDILVFVDSDVIPYVLTEADGNFVLEEIDFIGRHLEYLNAGSQVTTSEYSGYNILPPASFDGTEDLLLGLQKDDMLSFWLESEEHDCLKIQTQAGRPEPCKKVLGGNAGFRLEAFSVLPPFFSSYYMADGDFFLTRGEDTILSLAMVKNKISCTDIQTYIFHDTYGGYPAKPDLRSDAATQKRFFYACAGWIGRNPFYNYLMGQDLQETRDFQRRHLAIGARALADYTSNSCFLTLPDKLETSWASLDRYISEYDRLLEAWSEFIIKSCL